MEAHIPQRVKADPRSACGASTNTPTSRKPACESVCDTPALSRIRINSLPNAPKSGFVNREQKEFLNAAGMLPDSSDSRNNGNGSEPNRTTSTHACFIDEKQLLTKLPISRRTLGNWKAKGFLPYIKIGRRCLYDWASVQGALLRRQRGGQW